MYFHQDKSYRDSYSFSPRFHPESNWFWGLYIFQRNWHLKRSMECFFTIYFSWENLNSLTWWLRRTYHHKKEQVFNLLSETCDFSSWGLLFFIVSVCFDVKPQCRNTLTLTCLIFFPGRTNYYSFWAIVETWRNVHYLASMTLRFQRSASFSQDR